MVRIEPRLVFFDRIENDVAAYLIPSDRVFQAVVPIRRILRSHFAGNKQSASLHGELRRHDRNSAAGRRMRGIKRDNFPAKIGPVVMLDRHQSLAKSGFEVCGKFELKLGLNGREQAWPRRRGHGTRYPFARYDRFTAA